MITPQSIREAITQLIESNTRPTDEVLNFIRDAAMEKLKSYLDNDKATEQARLWQTEDYLYEP